MQKIKTFVLAKPGLMRNALQAYLQAVPDLELVFCDQTPQTLYQQITFVKQGAVVIDLNGDQQTLEEVIKKIKATNPEMHCVVIADKLKTQTLAKQWGADQVLQHGLLDERLGNAIQRSVC